MRLAAFRRFLIFIRRALFFPHFQPNIPVVAFEPGGQAVEAGEKDPFIDVGLVELIADLPFQGGRYDDPDIAGLGSFQPVTDQDIGIGHKREDSILVHNAVVYGWRLKEDGKVILL